MFRNIMCGTGFIYKRCKFYGAKNDRVNKYIIEVIIWLVVDCVPLLIETLPGLSKTIVETDPTENLK